MYFLVLRKSVFKLNFTTPNYNCCVLYWKVKTCFIQIRTKIKWAQAFSLLRNFFEICCSVFISYTNPLKEWNIVPAFLPPISKFMLFESEAGMLPSKSKSQNPMLSVAICTRASPLKQWEFSESTHLWVPLFQTDVATKIYAKVSHK